MNAPAQPAQPPILASAGDVTQWLQQVESAPGDAVNHLFSALYADLKRAASAQLRRESDVHTLSATALLHEAWFRLSGQSRTQWQSRSHFLGVASLMMRRILVNHALAKRADKRDVLLQPLTLSEFDPLAAAGDPDIVAVHDALLALEAVDPRAAKVVELKFFGGLENEEVAEAVGASLATVKRDWTFARTWLHRALATR
jgi:RNA polymerase sigma factor (TIGR02999 family)